MAQTEALTAQLAQTQLLERVQQRANAEAVLPMMTTSPSEFGSRYNALFGSPLNPRVSYYRHASPIGSRQPSPERPRVFNTFPNSEPIQTPSSSPQMIVIQRPAVELLSHVPTYNGESTAAAISFLGAANNAKRNEGETTKRMIIASAARLTLRASQ
jgi:hypothetical protein